MEIPQVKVQYLYHSGFLVETANNLLIFDYYQGSVKLGDKNIFVFSSHSHGDHFNPQIFEWQREKPNIKYILSSDISRKPKANSIFFMSPDEEIQIEGIKIKTLNSTDLGVAFLVTCEGINIFHAGDLNWWYWSDDTPEEIASMEGSFKEEIAKLKGTPIDLAFFPVDSRLEHNYYLGGEYFIKEIKPTVFIPMHFGHDYQATRNFREKMQDSPSKIVEITNRGQEIIL